MRGEPLLIARVVDREGRVLEENTIFREEVIDPKVNFMITSLMESVMNDGFGRNARDFGFPEPAGGKTGTTDLCTDAWFVGFTGDLAVGVWSGFDEKKTMGKKMTGAFVSLPTWTAVMKTAYRDGRHARAVRRARGDPAPRDLREDRPARHRGVFEHPHAKCSSKAPSRTRTCDRHGSGSSRPIQDLEEHRGPGPPHSRRELKFRSDERPHRARDFHAQRGRDGRTHVGQRVAISQVTRPSRARGGKPARGRTRGCGRCSGWSGRCRGRR